MDILNELRTKAWTIHHKKNITNNKKRQVITIAIETFTALFHWINRNTSNDL